MKQRILSVLSAFLAVMLLFTLLSRAADNLSIARVEVQAPDRGKVTHKVSGSGKVESNREQAVSTLAGQVVKAIYVDEGQHVAEGDLLFEVDLETLKEQILEMQQEMKKQELQAGDGASGREARERQTQLQKARAEEDYQVQAQKGNTAAGRAWEELQKAKDKLETINKGQSSGAGDTAVQQVLQQTCEEKKLEYEQAVQYQKELQKAVDEAVYRALEGLTNAGEPTARMTAPEREYRMAAPADGEEEEALPILEAPEQTPTPVAEQAPMPEPTPTPEQTEAVQRADAAAAAETQPPEDQPPEDQPSGNGSGGQETETPDGGAQEIPESWPAGGSQTDGNVGGAQTEGTGGGQTDGNVGGGQTEGTAGSAQTEAPGGEWIVGEETPAPSTEDPYLLEKRIRLENQPLLDAAAQLVKDKEKEWQEAKDALDAYLQQQASGAQMSAEAMREQLLEEIRAKQQAYNDAVTAANDGLRTAGRAVEDASLPQASDSTGEIDAITREQAELALKKLERLQQAGGRVTAPVDGMVLKVNITTGERTPDGTAVLLSDKTSGSRLAVQVEESQAEYIARGDKASVSSADGKKKLEDLTVDSVRASEEDASRLEVTVQLPSDFLEAGMFASLESERDSASYDCRVPIQALYEDNGRAFVLVTAETQTVLGTELEAQRRDVTVLDKNETYAALASGALPYDAQVIVNADKIVTDGSRVRLKE